MKTVWEIIRDAWREFCRPLTREYWRDVMRHDINPRKVEFPCMTCGWWSEIHGGIGRCKHPSIDDETYRTFTCERHTGKAMGPKA